MEQLHPAYLAALASQLASLSAFLGGFAATFLATLLTLGHRGRLHTVTTGCAAIASVAFIVTVVAATMLLTVTHPDAPAIMADVPTARPRAIMAGGFLLGLLSLLASIGCSGWTKSRGIGWITTAAALAGIAVVVALTVQVG